MLAGVSGHLVTEAFLEAHLTESARLGIDSSAIDRLGRDLVTWRRRCDALGPTVSVRAILEVGAAALGSILGFETLTDVEEVDGAIAATLRGHSQPVALLVTSWGNRLDNLWRPAVRLALERRAPWCLLFNGTHLRVVDAGRVFARRYLEFALDATLEDRRSLAAFRIVLNASTLAGSGPGGQSTPLRSLVDASDRHASGVCRSLKDGVLAASADVLGALVGRRKARPSERLDVGFEQALTIVYRIVFLLFAEARALVPMWHPVYRESYSLAALRAAAEGPHGALGLWDALRAIARLAHAGCRAGDLRVTPFNGRLFAPGRTPLAERRDLDDEAARRAVLALSTRQSPERGGREPIAYRDLGVEQLGAVYETVLDYEPRVERAGRGRRQALKVTLEAGSGVRKQTGTFYTPQPIAEYLVRRTLGPLAHDATPERILQLRIVDPGMGSGAFLVAACRYLAAAYESALVRGGACHETDIGEPERAGMRRTIAERCLYGVDKNPMAVQLARLSLWLTTLAADRPLTFLDHRLQVGDSLLGAWLTALRSAPERSGRRHSRTEERLPLFEAEEFEEALRGVLPLRFSLESTPNDTIEQVRAKERALAAINARTSSLATWRRVADLWCATWFSIPDRPVPAAAFGALSDSLLTPPGTLPPQIADRYLRASEDIACSRRFFHWELEFPEVFFDANGTRLANAGFAAVIGNPPWDMLRADDGSLETRAQAREDARAVLRFTRDAGIYTAQSDGHANRYQLFLERAVALTRSGGRIGMVVPSGFATDHGCAALRRLLLTRCQVDALVGFDNRRGVFPIHRSVRFLLLTASTGRPTDTLACRFGLEDPAELEAVGDEPAHALPWFPVRIPRLLLDRVSGAGLAIPWFQKPIDVALVERAAALFPPLGSARGWSATFGRELNASEDRESFRPPGAGLPIAEGRHIEPFSTDLRSARHSIARRDAARLLPDGRYDRARLAYRDVAGATNRLTLIAAVLPPGCVSTHTLFCLRSPLALADQHLLCGLFNSFIVNFLVRLQVTLHVTTGVVERLPIPTREHAPAAAREIVALARWLARRADPGAFARLQASVADLYQLTVAEFAHVLSTFPLVAEREREAALTAFTTGTQRTRRSRR